VAPRQGGGPATVYAAAECERLLAEVRRPPDRDQDRTATWSLMPLRQALRRAPDGLPTVSTFTIWGGLARGRLVVATQPHLVPDWSRPAQAQAWDR
jgi:hypothetical protein